MAKLRDVVNDVQTALQTTTRAEETIKGIVTKDREQKVKVQHELWVIKKRLAMLREELKKL